LKNSIECQQAVSADKDGRTARYMEGFFWYLKENSTPESFVFDKDPKVYRNSRMIIRLGNFHKADLFMIQKESVKWGNLMSRLP
jgi:hypothetical protein